MIQDQIVPIKMGQGVDTKSDPKTVASGRMLRLQDAVQVNAGQWRKRNGYQKISNAVLGGGTITAPRLVATFKDELVCADAALGQLFAYSPTKGAWVSKGNYVPVEVSNKVLSRFGNSSHQGTTGAVLGNIALFAWRGNNGVFLGPQGFVMDLSSGTSLIADYSLTSSNALSAVPKCALLGGSTLAVIYLNSSANIAISTVSLGAGSATFNPGVSLNTDVVIPAIYATGTASGGVVAYYTGSSLKVVTFNTLGVAQNTATLSVGSTANTICFVSVDAATGRIWVYWYDNLTINYAVYDSSLTPILATASAVVTTWAQTAEMVSVSTSSTTQSLFYSGFSGSFSGYENLATTNVIQLDSVGTPGASVTFAQNVKVHSEAFSLNGAKYITCLYPSDVQGTYFVLKISDGTILAKFLNGSADHSSFYVTQPLVISASRVILPLGDTYALSSVSGVATPATGSNLVTLDFGSTETYQSIQANDNLVLNGGQVFSYDGKAVTELGFHLYPYFLSTVPSSTGGSIAAGKYSYYAVFRYVDDQGNIYDSAPSVASQVTLTGSISSVVLKISSCTMTAKQGRASLVTIRLFRTTANSASAFLISVFTNIASQSYLTFTDTLNDANVIGSTPLYTNGGTLENIAPPPCLAMALFNNRLWLIPSDDRNKVWYSKSFTPTGAIEFSDLLTVQVDSKGGDCVSVAPMDDKLVILCKGQPFVIAGDGANDTGTGSTLSNPQTIAADTGCIRSKSVITYPGGVLFKSPKGIYLLDRSLGLKYFAADVEAYNSQNIVSATMLADKNQIRFLCDSGLTLVYDYAFNQWSTFTNHAGYGACVWQGAYVYATTAGDIYKETPGYYLDDTTPFAPLMRLSWLALSALQGFQRVRQFLMLGDFTNGASAGHGVQVSAAYDFVESFSAPITYLFGTASASGAFQYQERLPRQKCDTISLIIQEVTTGDPLEYIDFTDMSFEAGVKRGLNKLPNTRSVG